MSEKLPMTPRGKELLREELHKYKDVERYKNVRDIEEARAHGDISENAEFAAAKERQAFIVAKIRDLESRIALSEVIDPKTLSGETVVFGATITVCDAETEEQFCYQIVGEDEADIKSGLISITAPLARAMIGKGVGDEVKVLAPKGERTVEIVKVEFV